MKLGRTKSFLGKHGGGAIFLHLASLESLVLRVRTYLFDSVISIGGRMHLDQ